MKHQGCGKQKQKFSLSHRRFLPPFQTSISQESYVWIKIKGVRRMVRPHAPTGSFNSINQHKAISSSPSILRIFNTVASQTEYCNTTSVKLLKCPITSVQARLYQCYNLYWSSSFCTNSNWCCTCPSSISSTCANDAILYAIITLICIST